MEIGERIRTSVRSISIEFIAIWYLFWDRRVAWYAKLLLLLPVVYIVSPLDLLADTIPLWGQADDLVVLRFSYVLIRKFADKDALQECRAKAAAFWDAGRSHRVVFCVALALVWGLAIIVLARYVINRFSQHA